MRLRPCPRPLCNGTHAVASGFWPDEKDNGIVGLAGGRREQALLLLLPRDGPVVPGKGAGATEVGARTTQGGGPGR